jgi:general nucleoside transport system permease protein
MLQLIFSADFFFAILRITAPILLVTLAAVICEKAGVSNIGLEGTMMISALFGSLFAYYAKNWFVGLLVAVITGVIVSLLMGFFAFNLKTNIILTGTAVNMIGNGGTIFLVKVITGITEGTQMTSTNGLITSNLQIPVWNIPIIKDIPVIGSVLSGHCILTYIAFLLVLVTWVLLYKTPLGLNIRSVGENPNAASSVGVSVIKIKYIAFVLGGVLAGLSGAYMSMYYAMGWSQNMVAGRGFIALAAQAMGSGEPLGSMLAALIFGFAQALSVKVSSLGVNSFLVSPIPYAITIIGLVIFAIIRNNKEKKAHSSAAVEVAEAKK